MDDSAMPVTEPREIWFARRFPIGSPRSGMAPVNWKGWAVVGVFILGMIAGGLAWGWFAHEGDMAKGVWTFIVIAAAGGLFFIRMANHKGDHVHTIADYEKGKLRV
jgi:hypothetical protein